MQEVLVNESEADGVLFVTRPPDLRQEPLREDFTDKNDDQQMEKACERIRRLRAQDLSESGLAFWEALEAMHKDGRHAGAVPDLPCTKTGRGRSFTFTGCPQPLIPLLRELRRFPRPLITWDIFGAPPPSQFPDPSSQPLQIAGPLTAALPLQAGGQAALLPLQMAGPSAARPSAADEHPLAIRPSDVSWPSTILPAMPSTSSQSALPSASADPAASLRDPRRVNHVGHRGYRAAAQARDAAELSLEDWIRDWPGRVEKVQAGRMYVVRLEEPDGEFHLGLVTTEGKVFEKEVKDEAGAVEVAPHIKALWFARCNDQRHAWPQNPAFEPYMMEEEEGKTQMRVTDDLPTESCLVEVEDKDLTDGSVDQKQEAPKLKEAFVKKLRAIADKCGLHVPADAEKKSAEALQKKSGASKKAVATSGKGAAAAKAKPSAKRGRSE